MNKQAHLLSEEDIRTKIVTVWLADHGFGPADISVETSFEVRLGRGIFRVESGKLIQTSSQSSVFRPRADILVRSRDGRNLLIVEVKAPNKPLDNEDREQGISYARLLRDGGIAPFVVLTNGHETRIYDSISGKLVDGMSIPSEHPHVRAGFIVSGDDLALRSEALEAIISLSSDNLIEFCRAQASYRMRLLRSDDPYSGKKYIPALYIEREKAREDLTKLLDKERRRVVILVGPPQVGKTNFVCHTLEQRIERGTPCLFYPAVGMRQGLLEEISEDFEWIMGDSSLSYHIVHNKLSRILRQTGQRLVIFIDGWNEANLTLARCIDRESERLSCDDIAFVISMTNVAASRLLLDDAGNLSYLAEAASIGSAAIPLLEMKPEKQSKDLSVVSLARYTSEEKDHAYRKYAETFDVQVPSEHHRVDDPFILRIGMEMFHGQTLPKTLNEPTLLAQSIQTKASRAVNLEADSVPILLSELADEMFSSDAPVRQSVAMKRWGVPAITKLPRGLFEAALLAKVRDEQGMPAFDFYFGRERDFVMACWTRDWPQRLKDNWEAMLSELSLAARTQVGKDALRWFLTQPSYEECLKSTVESLSLYSDTTIRRVLLSSLWQVASRGVFESDSWILNAMYEGARDPDMLVRAEAAKLIALLTEDAIELASILSTDEELIAGLLMIEEEYPLGHGSAGYTVLAAMQNLHLQLDPRGNQGSEITELLIHLMDHECSPFVRTSAAKALGYSAPEIFLRVLSNRINSCMLNREMREAYAKGIELAVEELREVYYGSLCPGYLDVLLNDPEQLANEYIRMHKICGPVIAAYWPEKCSKDLWEILRALQPENFPVEKSVQSFPGEISFRRYQLPLPFDDFDISPIGG